MTDSSGETESRQDAPERPHRFLPRFRSRALSGQLRLDAAGRGLIAAAVGGALVLVFAYLRGDAMASVLAVLVVLAGWLAVSMISARASRDLPHIGLMVDADPGAAEEAIAGHLRRWPLLRWVRLLLYHRLAVLRHRQRRYEESAAICQAVLSHRLGPAAQSRPHLLLMLVESHLHCGNLLGAYLGLVDLCRTRLGLVASLQRLLLQTRYEVAAGHDAVALERVNQKVQMAELMPAPQCGAMHAMLAVAAGRTEQTVLADWFWERAELLCSAEHLTRLRESDGDTDGLDLELDEGTSDW